MKIENKSAFDFRFMSCLSDNVTDSETRKYFLMIMSDRVFEETDILTNFEGI